MNPSNGLRDLGILSAILFLGVSAIALAEEEAPPYPPEKSASPGTRAAKPVLSIDEAYVRERLAGALHPTSIRFLPDGRVKIIFNFLEKTLEQARIFTPPVSQDQRSPFRWTIRREESFAKLKGGGMARKRGGLRIAEKGTALLHCWFLDDVDVRMDYVNSVSFDPRQIVAVVFMTDSGKALGSNLGTQCATYVGGVPRGESRGKPVGVEAGHHVDFKLVLKEGTCQAYFEKKLTQSMQYDRSDFASGRIGFLWGPGIAGIVKRLEITGKLDVRRMAKELRRAEGS
jgi:hypothetical protein